MTNFDKDFERGAEVEKIVLDQVRQKYPCATIITGHKGYDIWIPEIKIGIEVKYDPMSNETGNIVIEVEYGGKDSALLTTEAEFWVIFDGKTMCWIKPVSIFACIIKNGLKLVSFTGNGDKKEKRAFLVEKKLLFSYASQLKTLKGD